MNAIYMHSRDSIRDKPKLTDEQQKLVSDNLGLAYQCAGKWPIRGLDTDDNQGEALFCLCRAASRFDASKGFAFSTYAVSVWMNWRKTSYQITNNPNRDGNVIFARYNHEDLKDWEPRDKGIDPRELIDIKEDIDKKLELMVHLDQRAQKVLRLRAEGKTLLEVSRIIGVTRERIRQIEFHSFFKLGVITGIRRPNRSSHEEQMEARRERTQIARQQWRAKIQHMKELSVQHPEWTSTRLSKETGIGDRICRKYIARARQCSES